MKILSVIGRAMFFVFVRPILMCVQHKNAPAATPQPYRQRQYRDAARENSQTRADRRRYR